MEWQNAVMYCVGLALICLAIKKKYEPALQELHKGQPFLYRIFSTEAVSSQSLYHSFHAYKCQRICSNFLADFSNFMLT